MARSSTVRTPHHHINFDLWHLLIPPQGPQIPWPPQGKTDTPQWFWDAWARHATERPHARYAAVTMPLERLGCTAANRDWQLQARGLVQVYNLSLHSSAVCQTPLHRGLFHNVRNDIPNCCRLGVASERNEMRGLPSGWFKLDQDSLTSAAAASGSPAQTVVGFNWHYECYADLTLPGLFPTFNRLCRGVFHHSEACVRFLARNVPDATTGLSWQSREHGDCGEDGNTLLWEHLAMGGKWSFFRGGRS